MTKYILVHDSGTTGNKACLFDDKGELRAMTYFPYETYYPQPGYAEQYPDDWWKAVCSSTREILKFSR